MKGIFKPLRYFSQMFDGKEQEMQIGFPTDVKHVAHIGWDGPSVTNPTWMNEYKSAPLDTTGSEPMADGAASSHSHDLSLSGATEPEASEKPDPAAATAPIPKPSRRKHSITESPLEGSQRGGESPAPKPSRRHASSGGLSADGSSPDHARPSAPRHSRRNKSTEAAFVDTSGPQDPSEGSTRRGRRTSRVKEPGNDSDLPAIPKQGAKKKKKPKGGSCADESSIKSKAAEATVEPPETQESTKTGETPVNTVETPVNDDDEVKVSEA